MSLEEKSHQASIPSGSIKCFLTKAETIDRCQGGNATHLSNVRKS